MLNMLRPRVSIGAAAMLVLLTSTAVLAADGGRKFTTTLAGANEAPDPGDPDATGTASFTVNIGQSQVCYELTVANIEPATAAHIHKAPPRSAGPAVVPLTAPTNGSSSGCATVDKEVAKGILKNPQDYYVNVHNTPFPGGAARGQLAK